MSVHIAQIGSDATVFRSGAPSDTLRRQQGYAADLHASRPGSRLTYLVTGAPSDARRDDDGPLSILPVASGAWGARQLAATLREAHRERAIDVVTTQTPFVDGWIAQQFGRSRGIPTVAQIHYDIFDTTSLGNGLVRWKRRFAMALCRRRLRHFAAIRVVSSELVEPCRRFAPEARIDVIPVPVTVVGRTTSMQEPAGPAPTKPTLLFVGRAVAQKNLPRWLRVARRIADELPEARFVIAGDGPERRDAERFAQKLGIASRTRFLGNVAHDELEALYSSASALMLTSDYEGFGRVIVEAALLGVPSVATDILGPRDLVDNGRTGFLRAAGDEPSLARAALDLLKSPQLRHRMGSEARSDALARFAPETLTHRWVNLLIETAEASSAALPQTEIERP